MSLPVYHQVPNRVRRKQSEEGWRIKQQGLSSSCCCQCLSSQQRYQPALRTWYGTIPWGDQPATRWWVVIPDSPLRVGVGQSFVLPEMDMYSRYEYNFPHALAGPPSESSLNIWFVDMRSHIILPQTWDPYCSKGGTKMAKDLRSQYTFLSRHNMPAWGCQKGLLRVQVRCQVWDKVIIQDAQYTLDRSGPSYRLSEWSKSLSKWPH